MHKYAFKMGFSFKLAEAGVAPSQLSAFLEKQAKGEKKDEKDEEKSPTMGFGADGLTGGIKPLAIGLSGALGASSVIPASIGRLGGGMLASGLANQMDTTDELRTRYLIKRYRDFIQERKAQMNNKLVSEALRG
jgi:hypothetical protein